MPTRHFLTPREGRRLAPSAHRALPRQARVWEIGTEALLLGTGEPWPGNADAELRLTLGGEVEDIRRVSIELDQSKRVLGDLDVRYGCTFQPFAFPLSAGEARAVCEEGVRLRVEDPQRSVCVLDPKETLAEGLGPHLLLRVEERTEEMAWQDFDQLLATTQTLQPFNWIEGCVLDGLRATGSARAQQALAEHLEFFFPGGLLEYTGPRGEPRREEIFGIEALLPFAFLPAGHPKISLMKEFVEAKTGGDGLILDRGEDAEGRKREFTEITIEGCYTLSYPLAVGCQRDGEAGWKPLAWAQIGARCQHLIRDGVVAQRARLGAEPEQADWARAYGWFLLGVARTAETLGDCPAEVAAIFDEVVRRVLSCQRHDGLWSVYLGEEPTGSDTSGSAAIAAGLALGAKLGLIAKAETERTAREAARHALAGFVPHLAADGMLGGVAQLNRGGEPLQRGGFRVLAPFAMGLLASARAVVDAS